MRAHRATMIPAGARYELGRQVPDPAVLKNSLWLMPLIAALVGLLLAELLNWVDSQGDLATLQYPPETATAVVSATIAVVVSLTGFVVTVTVLGVQHATGIFSPRYMRLWYRDGRLKLVLAALVGTLVVAVRYSRPVPRPPGRLSDLRSAVRRRTHDVAAKTWRA